MEFILVSLLLVVFTFADATVCVSDTEYESYMMTTLIKDIEERIKSFRQSIKVKETKCPDMSCRDEWVSYNKSCYYFEAVHVKTFTDARVFCKQNGAVLLYVNDEEENTFIIRMLQRLKASSVYWFIGLTDQHSEGNWKWIDTDTPVKFTQWYKGEPSGGTNENCVIYYDRGSKMWHDIPCSRKYLFICKKERST